MERSPPRRVNYGCFSRELRDKNRQQATFYRDEQRIIRERARALKREKPVGWEEELAGLKQRKTDLRERLHVEKHNIRNIRSTIKEELATLRAKRRGADLAVGPTWADPWEARVPGMEKLFPAHDTKVRTRVLDEVTALLSDRDGSSAVDALVDCMDRHMATACAQSVVVDYSVMDAVLNAVVSSDNFLKLLNTLQHDDTLLTKVESDSYHHDLFDKTVLLSGRTSKWKLRMHVFLPQSFTVSQEEVHSHRNHFVSHIMYGGFSHELWCNGTEGEENCFPLHKYVYDPLVKEDGSRVFNITPQGSTFLRRLEEVSVEQGQSYYMHPSVLHSVTMLKGYTVTCVLNSPQVSERSCFATHEPWAEETFERPRFTKAELVAQFDHVRQLLRQGESGQGADTVRRGVGEGE